MDAELASRFEVAIERFESFSHGRDWGRLNTKKEDGHADVIQKDGFGRFDTNFTQSMLKEGRVWLADGRKRLTSKHEPRRLFPNPQARSEPRTANQPQRFQYSGQTGIVMRWHLVLTRHQVRRRWDRAVSSCWSKRPLCVGRALVAYSTVMHPPT